MTLALLAGILGTIERIAAKLPVVAPVHPRLRTALARSGLDRRIEVMGGLMQTDPIVEPPAETGGCFVRTKMDAPVLGPCFCGKDAGSVPR